MKNRLTGWFPADVKPVHIGWYHTKRIDAPHLNSDYNWWWWDGTHWKAFPFSPSSYYYQQRIWRGLAEKPE